MKRFFFILLTLTSAVSCVREAEELQPNTPVQPEQTVSVPLQLTVDDLVAGTELDRSLSGTSRAVTDDEKPTIQNVWVLQFNGTTDNSMLIGVPTYIADYSTTATTTAKSVQLIPTTADNTNTVIFVANSFEKDLVFPQGLTLGEFKKRRRLITNQTDLFGAQPTGTTEATETTYHPILNGAYVGTISAPSASSATTISCQLKRNIARIDFKITVGPHAGITITDVELRSVPKTSYYYTNHNGVTSTIFPTEGSFETIDYKPYSIDNEAYNPSSLFPTQGSGEPKTYRFYTSVNQRGTVSNTAESAKNRYAPMDATYVYVTAKYTDSGTETSTEIPIYYSFYLGANLTDDFNLKPNHSYSYQITINDRGNMATDSRIDGWDDVDFTIYERANCYILNPAPTHTRKFYIPIDRINEFWGNKGYENVPGNTISSTAGLSCNIFWADLYTNSGQTPYSFQTENIQIKDKNGKPCLEVSVPSGISGNMVVGVKKSNTNNLWSWHLWITDYCPDDGLYYHPVEGRYVYNVTGGALHRYEGAAWDNDGDYKNRFIMDRNVGMLQAGGYDKKGSLYYQFGRKDPFPDKSCLSQGQSINIQDVTKLSYAVIYSVWNPNTFIYGAESWLTGSDESKYGGQNLIWHDPRATRSHQTDTHSMLKSIFDPCPPGWCLPINCDIWSDFRVNNGDSPTTNIHTGNKDNSSVEMSFGFPDYSQNLGLYYWPFSGNSVSNAILYPAANRIDNKTTNAEVNSTVKGGHYWSAQARGTKQGRHLSFIRNSLEPSRFLGRAYGFSVRCVRQRPGIVETNSGTGSN